MASKRKNFNKLSQGRAQIIILESPLSCGGGPLGTPLDIKQEENNSLKLCFKMFFIKLIIVLFAAF